MRKSRRFTCATSALTVLCALGAAASARAEGSVSALHMGVPQYHTYPGSFFAVVQQYNASGERFRIDSHCQSLCTIFLSIRNVCITPNATLLFSPGFRWRDGRTNTDLGSAQDKLSAYNPALRKYLTEHHFLDDPMKFQVISGRDMVVRFGYPACR